MIRPLARAGTLLLVAPFLAFASTVAPQHVHQANHDHGHAVAHSHFAPHVVDVHHNDGTEIEHNIEQIVWLDSAILHEAPYRAAPTPTATPGSFDIVHVELRWSPTQIDGAAPAHGPPKRSVLFRGPPPTLT